MFYPKCPKCGGKSQSIHSYQRFGFSNKVGHVVPPLGFAMSLGEEAAKRVALTKRCKKCSYEFR